MLHYGGAGERQHWVEGCPTFVHYCRRWVAFRKSRSLNLTAISQSLCVRIFPQPYKYQFLRTRSTNLAGPKHTVHPLPKFPLRNYCWICRQYGPRRATRATSSCNASQLPPFHMLLIKYVSCNRKRKAQSIEPCSSGIGHHTFCFRFLLQLGHVISVVTYKQRTKTSQRNRYIKL